MDYLQFLKRQVEKMYTNSDNIQESTMVADISPVASIEGEEKFYPEYTIFPYDESLDEDLIEDADDDFVKQLRNPELSLQEVFETVYVILTSNEEIEDETAMKLVAIALERFFEYLNIDRTFPISKPYQLFFAIYRYFFVTYAIERLALTVLLFYVTKHKRYLNLYVKPFTNITLNNAKNINAILSAIRYVSFEDLLSIVDTDDNFIDYFKGFIKRIANEKDILELGYGIDINDFQLLLPYLTEDDNTVRALYKLIFNLGIGELCKFECLMLLTGSEVSR